MRNVPFRSHRSETYEQQRQRMLDETARFIAWGLKNPDKIPWIPVHPVGTATFPQRLKETFWLLVLNEES